MPQEFPPWEAAYQQTQRWLPAGCIEAMVRDLRPVLRTAQGKQGQPIAVILDGRTLQSTCERDPRAGYDGYKRKKGSKVHMAGDTLVHLPAMQVTPANEQERIQARPLAREIQHGTGETVTLALVGQGYTGKESAEAAKEEGIALHVVKLPEAKKGFVLLPRRWVVERSVGWSNRLRRMARDYECLPETSAGLHFVTSSMPML